MTSIIDYFIYLFVFLYPILPEFTQISNYPITDWLFILFLIIYLCLNHKIMARKIRYILKQYWLVVVLLLIPFAYHRELYTIYDNIIKPIVIIMILLQWCDSKEKVQRIFDTILHAGFFMCILGIVESISKFNVFSIFQTIDADLKMGAISVDYRYGRVRIEGSFGQAIPFSLYLIFINTITIYKLFDYKNLSLKKRIFYFSLWTLSMICVFLTGSRTETFLLIVIQLFVLVLIRSKYKALVVFALIISFIIYLVFGAENNIFTDAFYGLMSVINSSYTSKMTDGGGTVNYRLMLFTNILTYLKYNPLLGMGYSHSLDVKFAIDSANGVWYQSSIDNNYLVWLLRYGILGLLGNILFNVMPLKYLRKRKKIDTNNIEDKKRKLWFVTILGYVIVLITVFQMGEKRIFTIIVGCLIALYYNNKKYR